MVVLGIDPGIQKVGYCFLENKDDSVKVLDYGLIETPSKNSLPERILMIVEDLLFLCKKFKPQECAIEKIFFAKNTKTAISVAEARGAIIYGLLNYGLKINEYTPLQVKVAITGYGNATKDQIQKVVTMILNLQNVPTQDDAADAIAISLCHLNTKKFY